MTQETQTARSIQSFRDVTKWIAASFAAVGGALLATSQLTTIGRLPVGWPTTLDTARLWVALACGALGFAAVIGSIWMVAQAQLPVMTSISEIAFAWDVPRSPIMAAVLFLRRNPKFLQGFDSPQGAIDARTGLVARLGSAESDESLAPRISDLDDRIAAIEDIANFEVVRARSRRRFQSLMAMALIGGIGILGFSWAANPPAPSPGLNLRGAKLVGAFLRDVDFRNAKLDGADLTGADLTGANLEGATISGVIWVGTTCPDGTNSNANQNTCAGHRTP